MSKKLLLADDSITIQKVIGITFANEDYELTVVDNGDAALEQARSERPDLILADVFMPGKNGYELCAAVSQDPQLKGIPVLLLTGTFEPFDEGKAQAAGAGGWIAKPFESQALIDRVEELLADSAKQALPAGGETPAGSAELNSDLGETALSAGEESSREETPFSEGREREFVFEDMEVGPDASTEAAWGEEDVLELDEADILGEEDLEILEEEDLEEVDAGGIFEGAGESFAARPTAEDEGSGAAGGATPREEEQEEEQADFLASPADEDFAFTELDEEFALTEADEELDLSEKADEGFASALAEPAAVPAGADEQAMESLPEGFFEKEEEKGEEGPDAEEALAFEEDFTFADEEPEWDAAREAAVDFGQPPVLPEEEPAAPEVAAVAPMAATEAAPSPAVAAEVPVTGVSAPSAAEVEERVQSLSDADLEKIVERLAGSVVERLAGTILERVAWEVVPDLAESLIRDEIRKIKDAVRG